MMNDKERLINIKNDFINNFTHAVSQYINEFIKDDGSSEGYENLAIQESDIYEYRELLKKHFPELELSDIIEKAKAEGFIHAKANDYDVNKHSISQINQFFEKLI